MKQQQLFRWVPCLFTIAVILFIGSFSADGFERGLPFAMQLQHVFMHLIPAIFLSILLGIAWRWQKVGGIALLATGLALVPFVFLLNHQRNHFTVGQSMLVVAIINGPIIVSGSLFLLSAHKYHSVV
jgi:hypothetical protein